MIVPARRLEPRHVPARRLAETTSKSFPHARARSAAGAETMMTAPHGLLAGLVGETIWPVLHMAMGGADHKRIYIRLRLCSYYEHI